MKYSLACYSFIYFLQYYKHYYMNKIKHILLNHFDTCTELKPIIKDIVLIILSFCTPYYEPQLLDIDCKRIGSYENFTGSMLTKDTTYVTAITRLTNNRVALGFLNGSICILNLYNMTRIFMVQKDYHYLQDPSNVTQIHQIDDNIIIFTMTRFNERIFIWNIATNTTRFIWNNEGWEIIVMGRNMIAITAGKSIKILDLNIKPNETPKYEVLPTYTLIYPEIIYKISIFNDKAIIYAHNVVKTNCQLCTVNKNNLMAESDNLILNCFYEHKDADSHYIDHIIPCTTNFNVLCNTVITHKQTSNYVIIVECVLKEFNNIILYNIETGNCIDIITNLIGRITSIVYLNNAYFAVLIDNDIKVYNLYTKSLIQSFRCETGNYVALEAIDNGFIAVDDNSNVRLFY